MKNSRGITLIALVITVIVLIILGTITLGAITGSEGILDTSKEQIENYNNVATVGENQVSGALGILENENSSYSISVSTSISNSIATPIESKDVVFKDYNGDVISSNRYSVGDRIVVPANPVRQEDNTYTYTFVGWSPTVSNICNDNATYTATYTSNYKNYTVEFKNYNNAQITSNTYHYGAAVTVPANPTRPATSQYTYTFAGWTPSVSNTCNGDATYMATYTDTTNKYTVTFYDEDGTTVLGTSNVDYGTNAQYPNVTPNKAQDNTYTYTFDNWYTARTGGTVDSLTNITSNRSVYARYTSAYREYTVAFKNWDGTTLTSNTYHYNATVTVPNNPTRPATAQYTYTFAGWTPAVSNNCNGDATYTATYIDTTNKYTVTFYDEDGTTVLGTSNVDYGTNAQYPNVTPNKAQDNTYTYTFDNWYTARTGGTVDSLTNITSNRSVYARYTSAYREYTVAFKNWDGTILTSNTYHYNATVTVPNNPTRPADSNYIYTFSSWSPTVNATCTSNATYTATYTSVTRYFTVSYNSMGATGTIANQQKERDIDLTLSDGSGFTKEGYELIGWDTSSLGTTVVYDLSGTYNINSSQTLYAVWASDSIYAILYSDGLLSFNTTGNLAEGKTEADVYLRTGNIKYEDYTLNSTTAKNPIYGSGTKRITTVNFEEKIYPTSTACWFFDCEDLSQINNISNLDTSKVTNMSGMFYGCEGLTSLDVSGFDTSKVTNMRGMFQNCRGLTSLDVSGFDTSEVTNMYAMFQDCRGLTSLDVSGFDTSKVTNMGSMFDSLYRFNKFRCKWI